MRGVQVAKPVLSIQVQFQVVQQVLRLAFVMPVIMVRPATVLLAETVQLPKEERLPVPVLKGLHGKAIPILVNRQVLQPAVPEHIGRVPFAKTARTGNLPRTEPKVSVNVLCVLPEHILFPEVPVRPVKRELIPMPAPFHVVFVRTANIPMPVHRLV